MRKLSAPRKGIGARITELRIAANLTQKELAAQADVPSANIGFWERTNTPPPSDALLRIAKVLGTTADALLTGKAHVPAQKPGPAGRVSQTFDQVAKLPRSQQKKILDVVDALLAQQSS
jgi:transcriptional regulator with XRE-family HTH domain